MPDVAADPAETYSPRQAEVLERALELLVEGGEKALTTANLARAANCSKESLYRWFGDRDGLLAAVITHQAGKVGVRAGDGLRFDRQGFRTRLIDFATGLRVVLAGEVSLALNRLAIGQVGIGAGELGRLVLSQGRQPIETRLTALLQSGKAAGHIRFENARDCYRTLYGLIVRDMHVRLLLGDSLDEEERNHALQAARAADEFLRLHAPDAHPSTPGPAAEMQQPEPAKG